MGTAPGINVLSATVKVGSATAGGGTMFDPSGYVLATGTSFSGPHVAGVAALLKQAHPDWTPDMIRTAMINTATNMRSPTGAVRPDGAQSDSIIDQGGGLVDVKAAATTKALLGVSGVAVYDYSALVGSDFQPNEETATRGLKFTNPNTVLFTFTVRVIANPRPRTRPVRRRPAERLK